MNKLTTAALAGLVAVTTAANASVTRWDGFGAIGSYFIADVQDIFTLPGAVTSYKSGLYSELGGGSYSSSVWGGANFEVGPGVLSVWGNRPASVGSVYGNFVPSYGNTLYTPDESLDVIYGWALSEETTLGVGITRMSYGYQQKIKSPTNDYQNDYTTSDLGLSLGVEQKNVGPIALLEVGLQYNMFSGQDLIKTTLPAADEDKYSINGSDLDLRIGGDMAGENGAFSRIELGLNMDGSTGKSETQPVAPAGSYIESKVSGFGYNLGYAAGKSSDKGLGLVGLMLKSRSDVQEGINEDGNGYNHKRAYSQFLLQAGFAAESKVNSWLTIRGGLTTNVLHNVTRERTDNGGGVADVYTLSTSEYGDWFDIYGGQAGTASFGTSVTVGSLTIDGTLNQNLLWNGPYFVTGSSSGLNTNVSATWAY